MNQRILYILVLFQIAACRPDPSPEAIPDADVMLGGATTTQGAYIQSFQQPAANLNETETALHRAADVAFRDIFATAPNPINAGLGNIFNQNSCESCHVSNGRSPFPTSPNDLRGLLIRLSMPGAGTHGEPIPVPGFGGQLQNKAVFGRQPEAQLSWTEVEEIRTYAHGGQVSLSKPVFSIVQPYTAFPAQAAISPRIAPPVIGLGLLEAIAESDILALADPYDADGDGISGEANWVWDVRKQGLSLGRFGWKAGQPTLEQQSAAAYNQDMGITNPLFPVESCAGQPQADTFADDPEIDQTVLDAATFYSQSLGVPIRRNWAANEVKHGKQLFFQIGCAGCHRQQFTTAQHAFGFLSQQTIYPYTDMLVHDMGEGLADGVSEFGADGREWRTPPLWGIGLTETVGGHSRFLHDGRARNLEEAILWHGGEAEASQTRFRRLTETERAAILAFLNSL